MQKVVSGAPTDTYRFWWLSISGFALFLLLMFLLGILWLPKAAGDSRVVTGRSVELTGTHADQQFISGDQVRISAQVADDIFAAGREVTLDGAKAHTLVVGARRLVMRNSTIHDLISGGLDVEIASVIEDDAVIGVCPICPWGTGHVLISKDAKIGHDARIASGTLEIQGAITGNLRAAARRIVISGSIGGKADLKAKDIVIASGARLGGEVIARSPTKPQIAPGATIVGSVREIPTKVDIPDASQFGKGLAKIAIVAALAFGLGVLMLGGILQLALPQFLAISVAQLRAEPWPNLGYGLVWALVVPAIAASLFAIVIGAPTAFVIMAAFIVLSALAIVTAGAAIGTWLRERRSGAGVSPGIGERIGWTMLGLLIVLVAAAVPFVGWIVVVLLGLASLGAVTRGIMDSFGAISATTARG
jgi:hypothetical protein